MDDTSIQVFSSQQFGELRALKDVDGEPWFIAQDVCRALGTDVKDVRSVLECDISDGMSYVSSTLIISIGVSEEIEPRSGTGTISEASDNSGLLDIPRRYAKLTFKISDISIILSIRILT